MLWRGLPTTAICLTQSRRERRDDGFRTVSTPKGQSLQVFFAGLAVFIGSLAAAALIELPGWLPVLGLIGFSVALVTMMRAHSVGFRCPNCRQNISELFLNRSASPFGRPVRYCPYRGEDFDSLEIDMQPSMVVGSEDPTTENPTE